MRNLMVQVVEEEQTRIAGVEQDHSWTPDFLGDNFQARTIELGEDPEGEGAICAVLVRSKAKSKVGILHVHGVTDYFFHSHVAEHFNQQGYAFYALELRKCGRARREKQTWHYTSDLHRYFGELNQALAIMGEDCEQIIPVAHSTGGLIVALWLDYLRRYQPEQHARIGGVIFNSPWLDLIVPTPVAMVLRPIISVVGKRWPRTIIPAGKEDTYGRSLHASMEGEWDYDLDFKPAQGHEKYFGWLRSVAAAQARIHKLDIDCGVPALTLCSTASSPGKKFEEISQASDTVLNVAQIMRWAPKLAQDSSVAAVPGAVHDVFLSRAHPRRQVYGLIDQWLINHDLMPGT